jgi:hypothetical protein
VVQERYLVAGRWWKQLPIAITNLLAHIGLFVITRRTK